MWLTVHLAYIITFRSKAFVLLNWAWNYVFYDRPVRLITAVSPDSAREQPTEAKR
jgi:NADH dehydrogenase